MKILITLRVDVHTDINERRDAIDQAWFEFLGELYPSSTIIPVPNVKKNALRLLEHFQPDLIVFTGGNDLSIISDGKESAQEREEVEEELFRYAERADVLVLGVCRGFQKMNFFLGGTISSCEKHVRTQHTIKPCIEKSYGLEPMLVNSYHNYSIKNKSMLSSKLEAIYLNEQDGSVEAARHRSLPWLGLMWHPERHNESEESQRRFIANFLLGKLAN